MDPKFQSILSLVRVCIIAVGGIVVHKGWATDDTLQLIVGAAGMIGPAIWAVWSNYHIADKTQAGVAQALNAGIAIANASSGPVDPVEPARAAGVVAATVASPPEPASPAVPAVQPSGAKAIP